MNKSLKIILSTILWCAIAGYLIFAARLCSDRRAEVPLSEIRITMTESDKGLVINEQTVRSWLTEAGYRVDSSFIHTLNTDEIRDFLESHVFVKKAKVYTTMAGVLNIEVAQRKPVVRFNTANGYNFYLSEDNCVLPYRTGSAVYVPVITGSIRLPFDTGYSGFVSDAVPEDQKKSDQSYLYLLKLINFVKLTGSSAFWDAQIVQINIAGGLSKAEPDVELVPRVGSHVIILGSLDDAEEKLEKLMLFYRKVLDYEGWDSYRTINLKYNGQVVCRK